MKKALILNNQILEIVNKPFEVAKPLHFVECGDEVKPQTHEFINEKIVIKQPKTQAEIDAENLAITKAELFEIDLLSIRSMREYIATKADAPEFLKAKEVKAKAARGKLK